MTPYIGSLDTPVEGTGVYETELSIYQNVRALYRTEVVVLTEGAFARTVVIQSGSNEMYGAQCFGKGKIENQ